MIELSLEHITVWEASPPEIVSIAADLGCQSISLFVHSPTPDVPVPALAGDTPLHRETAQRLAATGVRVHTLECFALVPDTRIEDFRPALEFGARLGASAATVIVFDPERSRATDHFARACEIAAEYRLGLNAEFIAVSALPSLAAAIELVEQVRQPNAGDGLFPLRGFLQALPTGITLGIEVPMKDLRDRGIPPRERARRAVQATLRLITEVSNH